MLFCPPSCFQSGREQKRSMATALKAICHAPKLLTVSGGLELCVQKSVVLLPASATLTGYLFQYPHSVIQFSMVNAQYERHMWHLT